MNIYCDIKRLVFFLEVFFCLFLHCFSLVKEKVFLVNFEI